ncbi:MAG: cytochrome D1 domain-containing protein [Pseudomonadota bacterium]
MKIAIRCGIRRGFVFALGLAIPILALGRGTGDLGLIVERADGAVLIADTSDNRILGRIEGLGDLSHASAVFSRDAGFGYVFGRDGGLSQIDLVSRTLVKHIQQAGNSIGGAISQDGRVVAVANYEPGGVRLFDAATLAPLADIPTEYGNGQRSKVVGLADAPGRRLVFSLWDAGEIWVADIHDPQKPILRKFPNIGRNPYDGLITPDGRFYLAGLFGEDGLALLDLWNLDAGVRRILPDYGPGDQRLPVFKMPHLRGWAMAGGRAFLPGVGRHQVLVVDTRTWQQVASIAVEGQPVFVMARPDGRQVWVNFALPDNDRLQVIDTQSLAVVQRLQPGKGIMHLEFTPRGEAVWVSVRDEDRVEVYDTETFKRIAALPARKPSGILFSARAHRIGL